MRVGEFGDEAREKRLRWLRRVQRTDGEFERREEDGTPASAGSLEEKQKDFNPQFEQACHHDARHIVDLWAVDNPNNYTSFITHY